MAEVDTDAVLGWGLSRLRDLPWRATRDPWAVLVSEVMLQQTQVARVIPAWQSFLADYPGPPACAAAPLGDVLRRWQGLGYPRRARNLHATATVVTHHHAGQLPDTLPELLALPGIGPYTARAVLVFAYEQDEAVVDTNIARVLARVAGRRLSPRVVQDLADHLVPAGDGWRWNQVLMDIGATRCRPRPRCDDCPLASACSWFRAGLPEPDPAAGSARVSTTQAPFEGSDRQARGRLLRTLGHGSLARTEVAACMQVGEDRADRLVAALVGEGLVVVEGDRLQLP